MAARRDQVAGIEPEGQPARAQGLIGEIALDIRQQAIGAAGGEINLDAVFGLQHQFARLRRHVGEVFQETAGAMVGQRQMQPGPVMAVTQMRRQRLVADAL